MKTLVASFISLLFGIAIGWYFEHRHAGREMTDVVEQMEQPIEAFDRLEAARGVRAIQLIEAGNTNQAIEMFSFPIASFYTEYYDLSHNEKRTQDLLAKIEKFAQTNQVVAAQIKTMMSYGETNTEVR